jgi:toxin-antitoxin system PIN domain toxin
MKLVDANVLIYAVNPAAAAHERARRWIEASLSGSATVGFSWSALLAFLRISTRPVFATPLTIEQALGLTDDWLGASAARIVHPTATHARVLGDLLRSTGSGGNVVTDAHLAALAIEHRAEVVTFDRDFGRFPGVRWELPG